MSLDSNTLSDNFNVDVIFHPLALLPVYYSQYRQRDGLFIDVSMKRGCLFFLFSLFAGEHKCEALVSEPEPVQVDPSCLTDACIRTSQEELGGGGGGEAEEVRAEEVAKDQMPEKTVGG